MSDSIEIRPVCKESAKLVIGLAGVSGSGKTYTALEIAYGLVGRQPSKIGFLDTENRRGSLYADMFKDRPDLIGDFRFQIGDLTPPFTPARYVDAMRQFAASGVETLVVDSASHEWEGEGGCTEIAEAALLAGKKQANWIKAKAEHKKFMNALLLLPFHVITCFRARERMDFINKGPKGEPISMGIQPVCEKNVMYEMTLSFLLEDAGNSRVALKPVPAPLMAMFGGTAGFLTAKHGEQLIAWVGGVDPSEKLKAALRHAASEGTIPLKSAWESLSKPERLSVGDFLATLKGLAEHADTTSKLTTAEAWGEN